MKRALLACLFCVVSVSAARADTSPMTVLSPEDVATYNQIFAAQEHGDVGHADELTARLSDKSLMGYVLRDRYLSRSYRVKLDELVSWMRQYQDLDGAERIYRLAMKKRPRRSHITIPGPSGIGRQRGGTFDMDGISPDGTALSTSAQGAMARLRDYARASQPEAAEQYVRDLQSRGTYSPSDTDRLFAFVSRAYFADGKDADAFRVGDEIAERDNAPQGHWTAGLAAYRLKRFPDAARHFDAILSGNDPGARRFAGAAFWSARSHMRSGEPEKVMALYVRASSESATFYGMIASRLLGREAGPPLTVPTVDSVTFARMMQNDSAHRAVAAWQIGHRDEAQGDLVRAYSEMPAEYDPAFAALAERIGPAVLALRASESAARKGVYLTTLFPEPNYEPNGGYTIDKALLLGIARQESRLQPIAVSGAGARGVMQIMPDTAAKISGDPSLAGSGRARLDNPGYNLRIGQMYVRDLLDRSNGSLIGLCAAYNAGLGNLSKWLARNEGIDDPLLFLESIPFSETRDYIKRVLTNVWMYRKRFGEPTDGIDEAAAGKWPIYSSWNGGLAATAR